MSNDKAIRVIESRIDQLQDQTISEMDSTERKMLNARIIELMIVSEILSSGENEE